MTIITPMVDLTPKPPININMNMIKITTGHKRYNIETLFLILSQKEL